ncbi:bifunctional diguanylate cyclase/phosphodiesterase [Noviherbaspirillum suwonense]|uniref:PAS domain S-box-containing protein/diguanylate cyclase (GGDEF) domain-containing protein n=1 Tax=Noviherbaspirillum suwonense TaxID=1224511 RepID=A0ABY1QDX3_9BURK|nr:EAL domain-containing protein [Noviherbaspirillum suwonense]SMP65146.1 PAS domain S-box-containing protein/diguanylate cyclase (GGDEF) domain-containing protein [Noviherbaspirillum suwonense]
MSTHWKNQIDILISPQDGGNMAERVRRHDWASTRLGPADAWPDNLRVAVGMLLALPLPGMLLWGAEQVMFHNEAFARLLGGRFPDLLGASYPRHWPPDCPLAAPLHALLMNRQAGVFPQQLLPVMRAGREELRLHSISCSPVPEHKGAPGGMLLLLQDVGPGDAGQHARPDAVLQAERMHLLDEVFRRSPSFVHVLGGPDYRVEFANDAYCTLLGGRALLGRPLLEAAPELAAAGYDAILAEVRASGEPYVGREQPVLLARAPGAPPEERILDIVYSPLPDSAGRHAWLLGYGVDVTEKSRARRLAEQRLRDSEARLAAIFSRAAAGLSEVSVDGRFLRINDTLCRMLGRPREALLGASITEVTHPDDIPPSLEAVQRLLATGEPVALDKRYLRQDGSVVFCNSALTRLDDASGQPRALLVVTVDLTARRLAEAALRESEAFHRYAAEAGGIGKWEMDLATGEIEVSPQMAALLGYPNVQKRFSRMEWTGMVLPEDLPRLLEAMEAAASADAQLELEMRVAVRESSEIRWLHVRGGMIRNGGGSARLHGVSLDITERKATEAALRASEERYRMLTEMSPDAALVSVDGCIVYANPAAAAMLGAPGAGVLTGRALLIFIEPEFHEAVRRSMGAAAHDGGSPLAQQRWRRLDGGQVAVEVSAGAITWEGRPATQLLLRDVTGQHRIQEALRISNERLKLAIEGSGEGIWDWDISNDSYHFSENLKRMMAWDPESESPGGIKEAMRKRIHPDDLPRIRAALQAYVEGRESAYSCEFRVQRADGVWLWMLSRGIIVARDDNGMPLLMTGTTSDISAKKQADERIWHHANFDALTGLPNRRLFRDRLDQEVRKAARGSKQVALLFIDLDRFKQVNDLLGHDAGDLLLAQCASRIKGCVRESDTVARLGGDEFTVILTAPESPARVEHVCQKILHTLESPFLIGKEVAYMSGSIGVTLYPNDATTSEELIRKADQAMYAAKNAGKNQFSYFTYAMDEKAHLRLRLASELRSALPAGQLEVFYQPVLDLASGRLVKAEALLRWHHPRLGLVEPTSFIPLAEETGQINQIGAWVFKEAASRSLQWQEQLGEGFQISVNKSPIQFLSHNDDNDWLQHLRQLGLPGSSIAIELTEGMLLHASTSVTDKLLEYRDAGIQVAIDDFGTGYSSMAYLKRFDIDYLKIDQSFVAEIATDEGSRTIAESIIVMAHKLGLKVIAEGIETGAQLAMLKQAGCDYGQGFLFSAALPAHGFEAMLAADRAGRAGWRGLFQD